jgi:hypothetical protein
MIHADKLLACAISANKARTSPKQTICSIREICWGSVNLCEVMTMVWVVCWNNGAGLDIFSLCPLIVDPIPLFQNLIDQTSITYNTLYVHLFMQICLRNHPKHFHSYSSSKERGTVHARQSFTPIPLSLSPSDCRDAKVWSDCLAKRVRAIPGNKFNHGGAYERV